MIEYPYYLLKKVGHIYDYPRIVIPFVLLWQAFLIPFVIISVIIMKLFEKPEAPRCACTRFIHSTDKWTRHIVEYEGREYCAQIQLSHKQPSSIVTFFRGSLLDIKIKQIFKTQVRPEFRYLTSDPDALRIDLDIITMDDAVTFTQHRWPSDKKLTKLIKKL